MTLSSKMRTRVKRTIQSANRVDGRGEVIAIVYAIPVPGYEDSSRRGLAVRQDQFGNLDSVGFTVLSRGVNVLGKPRVLLP